MKSGEQAAADRREDAFRRAEQHSRAVGVLKWVLPTIGVVLAVGFLTQSYLAAPKGMSVAVDGMALSDGKLVMANPKLEGFTKENRPYSMTAYRAIQDVTNEGLVQLEGIGARLPISADNWAKVVADRGIFDRTGNTLALNSDVTITTDDGMIAKLKSAFVDIGTGGMKTDDPVHITLNGARITSDTMSITQHGKVLVFDKRVQVNIDASRKKAATP